MRVVLDTNIFVSALLKPESNAGLLLHRWLDGRLALLTSEAQIDELRRVSRYAKLKGRLCSHAVGRLVNLLREEAEVTYSV